MAQQGTRGVGGLTGGKTRLALMLMAALTLGGCAAERAYRDGAQLLASDQVEAGMARLAEARVREPENARYAIAYLGARDRAVADLLEQVERQRRAGEDAAADAALERVLALEPRNRRALESARTREAGLRLSILMAAA